MPSSRPTPFGLEDYEADASGRFRYSAAAASMPICYDGAAMPQPMLQLVPPQSSFAVAKQRRCRVDNCGCMSLRRLGVWQGRNGFTLEASHNRVCCLTARPQGSNLKQTAINYCVNTYLSACVHKLSTMGNWKRPADDMYDEEDENSDDYVPDRGNRPRKQKRCADRKRKDPSIPWSEEGESEMLRCQRPDIVGRVPGDGSQSSYQKSCMYLMYAAHQHLLAGQAVFQRLPSRAVTEVLKDCAHQPSHAHACRHGATDCSCT